MNAHTPWSYFLDAVDNLPSTEGRITLNQPLGNFFYDEWEILPEYENTIWNKLIQTLPIRVGEARLITLGKKSAYTVHADIDNRCHYSLHGDNSFLIDAENQTLHKPEPGVWYYMDAGRAHSAVNIDCCLRTSLVVRELLHKTELEDYKTVAISIDTSLPKHRFYFDKYYSGLLNRWQQQRLLANFSVHDNIVKFDIDSSVKIPKYSGFEVREYA